MILEDYILDLEKNYQDKIYNILKSDEFLSSLKKLENFIKSNYWEIHEKYLINNPIALPFQKLCAYYLPKYLNAEDPYASPICSDVAFFNKNLLLNIDAKTIDLDGNPGDVSNIQLNSNQFSFKSKPLLKEMNIDNSGFNFRGFDYQGSLNSFVNHNNVDKPNLTFLIKCIYFDDKKGTFDLDSIYLTNIMNGYVYEKKYHNSNIHPIRGFKTYNYLDSHWSGFTKLNKQLQKKFEPIKLSNFNEKDFHYFERSLDNKKKKFYIHKTLKDPIDVNYNSTWVKTSHSNTKCYRALYNGDNTRLNENFFSQRIDSNNEPWEGIKKINLLKL